MLVESGVFVGVGGQSRVDCWSISGEGRPSRSGPRGLGLGRAFFWISGRLVFCSFSFFQLGSSGLLLGSFIYFLLYHLPKKV